MVGRAGKSADPEVVSEENSQPQLSNTEHEVSVILERARLQAEEILLSAQAEADNVVLQAQSEIEDQKKQGYQQGLKDARLEMDDAIKAVRALVNRSGSMEKSPDVTE